MEQESTQITVTNDQKELIKRTVCKDATDDEMALFFYDCKRQGVHPLDKMIHFTKRSGKYTPVTSIDFMRTRAAETGGYAGNDDPSFFGLVEGDHPESATVTVYRFVEGERCAFTATARWKEYCPKGQWSKWTDMPHTMLGKCAEALALRKAFPMQLAKLYTVEELDQADAFTGNQDNQGLLPPERKSEAPPTEPRPTPQPEGSKGPVISAPQASRFYTVANKAGVSDADAKSFLKANFGVDSAKQLLREKYDEAIQLVQDIPREPGSEG